MENKDIPRLTIAGMPEGAMPSAEKPLTIAGMAPEQNGSGKLTINLNSSTQEEKGWLSRFPGPSPYSVGKYQGSEPIEPRTLRDFSVPGTVWHALTRFAVGLLTHPGTAAVNQAAAGIDVATTDIHRENEPLPETGYSNYREVLEANYGLSEEERTRLHGPATVTQDAKYAEVVKDLQAHGNKITRGGEFMTGHTPQDAPLAFKYAGMAGEGLASVLHGLLTGAALGSVGMPAAMASLVAGINLALMESSDTYKEALDGFREQAKREGRQVNEFELKNMAYEQVLIETGVNAALEAASIGYSMDKGLGTWLARMGRKGLFEWSQENVQEAFQIGQEALTYKEHLYFNPETAGETWLKAAQRQWEVTPSMLIASFVGGGGISTYQDIQAMEYRTAKRNHPGVPKQQLRSIANSNAAIKMAQVLHDLRGSNYKIRTLAKMLASKKGIEEIKAAVDRRYGKRTRSTATILRLHDEMMNQNKEDKFASLFPELFKDEQLRREAIEVVFADPKLDTGRLADPAMPYVVQDSPAWSAIAGQEVMITRIIDSENVEIQWNDQILDNSTGERKLFPRTAFISFRKLRPLVTEFSPQASAIIQAAMATIKAKREGKANAKEAALKAKGAPTLALVASYGAADFNKKNKTPADARKRQAAIRRDTKTWGELADAAADAYMVAYNKAAGRVSKNPIRPGKKSKSKATKTEGSMDVGAEATAEAEIPGPTDVEVEAPRAFKKTMFRGYVEGKGDQQLGAWYSAKETLASTMAKMKGKRLGKEGKVIKEDIELTNPLYLDSDLSKTFAEYVEKIPELKPILDKYNKHQKGDVYDKLITQGEQLIHAWAQKQGYDGAVYGEGESVVVFQDIAKTPASETEINSKRLEVERDRLRYKKPGKKKGKPGQTTAERQQADEQEALDRSSQVGRLTSVLGQLPGQQEQEPADKRNPSAFKTFTEFIKAQGKKFYHGTYYKFKSFHVGNDIGVHVGTQEQALKVLEEKEKGSFGIADSYKNQAIDSGESGDQYLLEVYIPDGPYLETRDVTNFDDIKKLLSEPHILDAIGKETAEKILGEHKQKTLAEQTKRRNLISPKNTVQEQKIGWDEIFAAQELVTKEAFDQVRNLLQALGYVGLKYKNTWEGKGYSYSIFSAEQVKTEKDLAEIWNEAQKQEPAGLKQSISEAARAVKTWFFGVAKGRPELGEHGARWGTSERAAAEDYAGEGGSVNAFMLKEGGNFLEAETRDTLAQKLFGWSEDFLREEVYFAAGMDPSGKTYRDVLLEALGEKEATDDVFADMVRIDKHITEALKKQGYDGAFIESSYETNGPEIVIVNHDMVEPDLHPELAVGAEEQWDIEGYNAWIEEITPELEQLNEEQEKQERADKGKKRIKEADLVEALKYEKFEDYAEAQQEAEKKRVEDAQARERNNYKKREKLTEKTMDAAAERELRGIYEKKKILKHKNLRRGRLMTIYNEAHRIEAPEELKKKEKQKAKAQEAEPDITEESFTDEAEEVELPIVEIEQVLKAIPRDAYVAKIFKWFNTNERTDEMAFWLYLQGKDFPEFAALAKSNRVAFERAATALYQDAAELMQAGPDYYTALVQNAREAWLKEKIKFIKEHVPGLGSQYDLGAVINNTIHEAFLRYPMAGEYGQKKLNQLLQEHRTFKDEMTDEMATFISKNPNLTFAQLLAEFQSMSKFAVKDSHLRTLLRIYEQAGILHTMNKDGVDIYEIKKAPTNKTTATGLNPEADFQALKRRLNRRQLVQEKILDEIEQIKLDMEKAGLNPDADLSGVEAGRTGVPTETVKSDYYGNLNELEAVELPFEKDVEDTPGRSPLYDDLQRAQANLAVVEEEIDTLSMQIGDAADSLKGQGLRVKKRAGKKGEKFIPRDTEGSVVLPLSEVEYRVYIESGTDIESYVTMNGRQIWDLVWNAYEQDIAAKSHKYVNQFKGQLRRVEPVIPVGELGGAFRVAQHGFNELSKFEKDVLMWVGEHVPSTTTLETINDPKEFENIFGFVLDGEIPKQNEMHCGFSINSFVQLGDTAYAWSNWARSFFNRFGSLELLDRLEGTKVVQYFIEMTQNPAVVNEEVKKFLMASRTKGGPLYGMTHEMGMRITKAISVKSQYYEGLTEQERKFYDFFKDWFADDEKLLKELGTPEWPQSEIRRFEKEIAIRQHALRDSEIEAKERKLLKAQILGYEHQIELLNLFGYFPAMIVQAQMESLPSEKQRAKLRSDFQDFMQKKHNYTVDDFVSYALERNYVPELDIMVLAAYHRIGVATALRQHAFWQKIKTIPSVCRPAHLAPNETLDSLNRKLSRFKIEYEQEKDQTKRLLLRERIEYTANQIKIVEYDEGGMWRHVEGISEMNANKNPEKVDYLVHPALFAAIEEHMATMPGTIYQGVTPVNQVFQRIQLMLVYGKRMKFFTPPIMWMNNYIQSWFYGGPAAWTQGQKTMVDPLSYGRYMIKGKNSWRDKDWIFFEALQFGTIGSAPFKLRDQTMRNLIRTWQRAEQEDDSLWHLRTHFLQMVEKTTGGTAMEAWQRMKKGSVGPLFDALGHYTWMGDSVQRLGSLHYLVDNGWSLHGDVDFNKKTGALQLIKDVHVDYARLPKRLNKALSMLFLTPTYQTQIMRNQALMIGQWRRRWPMLVNFLMFKMFIYGLGLANAYSWWDAYHLIKVRVDEASGKLEESVVTMPGTPMGVFERLWARGVKSFLDTGSMGQLFHNWYYMQSAWPMHLAMDLQKGTDYRGKKISAGGSGARVLWDKFIYSVGEIYAPVNRIARPIITKEWQSFEDVTNALVSLFGVTRFTRNTQYDRSAMAMSVAGKELKRYMYAIGSGEIPYDIDRFREEMDKYHARIQKEMLELQRYQAVLTRSGIK